MRSRFSTWVVGLGSVVLAACATPHTVKALEARDAGKYDLQLEEVRQELVYPSAPGQDHMVNVYVMGIDAISNSVEHLGKRASEFDQEVRRYYEAGRDAAVSVEEKQRLEHVMERYRAVSQRR